MQADICNEYIANLPIIKQLTDNLRRAGRHLQPVGHRVDRGDPRPTTYGVQADICNLSASTRQPTAYRLTSATYDHDTRRPTTAPTTPNCTDNYYALKRGRAISHVAMI